MAEKKKPAGKKGTKEREKNKKIHSQRKDNPLFGEIVFLFVSVFGILSLLSTFHMCGIFGEYLGHLLFGLLGAAAYLFPICLIASCGFLIFNPDNVDVKRKVWYGAGLFLSVCGLLEWIVAHPAENIWEIYTLCSEKKNGGGFLGGLLSYELARVLGSGGAFIVILALILLFFMLISRKLIFSSVCRLYMEHQQERKSYIKYEEETAGRERRKMTLDRPRGRMKTYKFETDVKAADMKESDAVTTDAVSAPPEKTPAPDMNDIRIFRGEEKERETAIYKEEMEMKFGRGKEPRTTPSSVAEQPVKEKQIKSKREKDKAEDEKEIENVSKELSMATEKPIAYRFPPMDLLSRPRQKKKGMDNSELRETALKLQNTLQSFGVRVKMGDISLGPSVTRYELIPEQGVKVSKITGLSDDIKLSLAASDIRIEAPIPGKAAVGVEVPNPDRTMITLRELLESREFQTAESKITFAVGKDISGKTIVTDIAKMPHLLIAGATGSGKSVLINTLIMSILYKADPNEVKMIMVDPKMVELTAYEGIPHLMIPVVKDPKKASAALAWAVAEMEKRYEKFTDAAVRDLESYNRKMENLTDKNDPEYQKMPQIVIIVDEFADLMMVAPGEVEEAVCRLAQLARAAGIHLVLATQRPSVNVITGLIKANIPSRIALSVSSSVDSRTILNYGGAEKLLGNGDMLFSPQNLPKAIRVQGAFVSDEERDGVVGFLRKNSEGPTYNEDVTAHIDSNPVAGLKNSSGTAGNGPEQDELFADAGYFIIEKDKASIGLLQRMFRIGFNRAARIMDQLADAGVVGPEEGTKARQILMSREQFENYLEENG